MFFSKCVKFFPHSTWMPEDYKDYKDYKDCLKMFKEIEQWIGKNWVCLVKHRDETFSSGGPAVKIVETGRGFGEVLFCNNSVSCISP